MALFPETRVEVWPIVFYPKGVEKQPSWVQTWTTMLKAAQEKFRIMLKNRDTFALNDEMLVIDGELTSTEYNELSCQQTFSASPSDNSQPCSQGVEEILAELIKHTNFQQYNRYTLPYILAVLMVDPDNQYGDGAGRNLNGEINRGGGITIIPTKYFDLGMLQTTLIHELGHTFGLVHSWDRTVDSNLFKKSKIFTCYYDKLKSPSIMSCNEKNQTNVTVAKQIPGHLLGDEIEALSLNKFVFPDLTFMPTTDFDCPPAELGCPQHDNISRKTFMDPINFLRFSTENGGNIDVLNDRPQRYIRGNTPVVGFDKNTMWQSGPLDESGWASLDATFPVPTTLSRVIVYSQHSGIHHRAEVIQIEIPEESEKFKSIRRMSTFRADTEVKFTKTTSRVWRFAFKGRSSGSVVIRGLQFFEDEKEVFPPEGPIAQTDYGEAYGSKVANLVAIQRTIRASSSRVKFDPRTMWHSSRVNELGWASIEITFPAKIALDKLMIYSQHSGLYHRIKQIQIESFNPDGQFEYVSRDRVSKPNATVRLRKREAQTWKFGFQSNKDEHVVIRGMRFFHRNLEHYPSSNIAK